MFFSVLEQMQVFCKIMLPSLGTRLKIHTASSTVSIFRKVMLGVHVQVGPPRFLFPLGWRAESLHIFPSSCVLNAFPDSLTDILVLCDSEVTRGHRPQLCRV